MSKPAQNKPTRVKPSRLDELHQVNLNAAGLDIGASEIWVSVPEDRDEQPVRVFGVYTPDLHRLADWLQACRVSTVAMESTGVYWVPVFEVLEARKFEVKLVNARQLKHVPGRKSDVRDCQWLQTLHTYGLLSGSFLLDDKLRALRAYVRQREMLLRHRSAHILHMQKAMLLMNLQLTEVLTDITGDTGMAIIHAILRGERDPHQLAKLRHKRCHKTEEEIAKALTGNYRDEHVFALRQAVDLYDFYTQQVRTCDEHIAVCLAALPTMTDEQPPELSANKKVGLHAGNAPTYDVRSYLYRLSGVDLVGVTGISASVAQTILSEVGLDMSRWPTSKHFCSWLGLAPHQEISGGKVLRSARLKTRNPAQQAFRLAAQAAGKSHTALGAYYRRMRARLGPAAANLATAHKMARIVYHLLKHRESFQDMGESAFEQRQRERDIKSLERRAAKLGLQIIPKPQHAGVDPVS